MEEINHTIRGGNPRSQYSVNFLQGMVNRMLTSYHKYGHIRTAQEHGVNFLESAQQRIQKYLETGNTEFLMDGANYLMMEFMYPSLPQAHFDAESKSPGRVLNDGRITDAHSEDL